MDCSQSSGVVDVKIQSQVAILAAVTQPARSPCIEEIAHKVKVTDVLFALRASSIDG